MTDELAGRHRFDLDLSLRRVVVGYRIVGSVWLTVLAAIAMTDGDTERRWVVGMTVAIVVGWTLATVSINRSRPEWFATEIYGLIDAIVAVSALLAPIAAGSTDFYGGYPLSAVFVAVYSRTSLEGLLTAAALAAASVIQLIPESNRDTTLIVTQVIFYLFIWFAVRWALRVLRNTDQQRRHAEAALADERSERIRAEERSELAAVLHDSVLQTLSLMQRRSDDPGEVRSLARYQERQLRERLYGLTPTGTADSLSGALTITMGDVEDLHRIRVETVVVGDCVVDPDIEALVQAAREAVVNAAKHAGVDTVSVYAEVDNDRVTLFVRDRGHGFDTTTVTGGTGIRESILARLERHGGEASIRSNSPGGTEVKMWIPRRVA